MVHHNDRFRLPDEAATLYQVVADDALEVIVTRALDARSQVSRESRNQLNRIIRRAIASPGFRDGSSH